MEDFGPLEDGESHRYAIVHLGGASRSDVSERFDQISSDLDIRIEPRGQPLDPLAPSRRRRPPAGRPRDTSVP